MVLCVRNDLGMGKGKMMAQCCHAAVGVVQELLEDDPAVVASWDENGAMKIALKVPSEEELDRLEQLADDMDLPNYLVVDAGHTQIAPDTKTVLAIGPAPAKDIDKITGHLKLM
jgi:peptidyl-tRNA hydrolase